MNIDLSGKVAIVTGAGRGIGREIATTLAREGVKTVATDVEQAYLDDFARECAENGWDGLARLCDVGDSSQIGALVEAVAAEWGRIDILVNNAGVARSAPAEKLTEEHWDRVHTVNLKGTFLMCRAVAPIMKKQRSGRILNAASFAAIVPAFGGAAYASSKAGVLRFTQAVSREYADTNLSIVAMAPGFVRTGLMEPDTLTPNAAERLKALDSALQRFGTRIEEAGELAVQLAGPATDGVTGKLYEVRPGLLQVMRGLLKRGG